MTETMQQVPIHNALKSVRKFHGMSLRKTAKKIGVSVSYLSELENGKHPINQDLIRNKLPELYSKLFDVPVSSLYLIAEAESKQSKSAIAKARRKVTEILEWIAEG